MTTATHNTMQYLGYVGSIQADIEADTLYGTVYGINDVIHYEGKTVSELEAAFRGSVDEYLAMCKESGEEPEKPYSGKFQARVGSELHRQASSVAAAEGISLNDFICKAIRIALGRPVDDNIVGRIPFKNRECSSGLA